MKYVIVLGDGMADEPIKEIGGLTVLEAANTPNLDDLAPFSEIGLAHMVPEGMAPGSDTANLSVLGYDPRIYYSGRSPLEALSIGVNLENGDVSFRCNLVTLSEDDAAYDKHRILDHSAGEISTDDAKILIEDLKKELLLEGYELYPGTSYRHLLVWKNGKVVELTPPHDILTREIGSYLPKEQVLREMMEKSYAILNQHPLNLEREKKGLNKANSVWFWGAGTKPALPSFVEKTGKRAVMVSAVDLLKGIANGADMKNLIVDGATGGLHTNYRGKAKAALEALLKDGYDFAYIHIEAPDEMGHQGSATDKIKAVEWIDELVIGSIREAFEKEGEAYRLLVLPDHPTPVKLRTHTKEPVPYLLYDSLHQSGEKDKNLNLKMSVYNEHTAKNSGHVFYEGYRLLEHLLEEG